MNIRSRLSEDEAGAVARKIFCKRSKSVEDIAVHKVEGNKTSVTSLARYNFLEVKRKGKKRIQLNSKKARERRGAIRRCG